MTVCCPYDESMAEVLPNATRFTALQDGAVMLRGVIDAYEISLSSQGLLVTLEGRGMDREQAQLEAFYLNTRGGKR